MRFIAATDSPVGVGAGGYFASVLWSQPVRGSPKSLSLAAAAILNCRDGPGPKARACPNERKKRIAVQ